MDEKEWQRRIDEHLASINRHIETTKDHMRESNELMARIDRTIERNTVALGDLSGFLEQVSTVLGVVVVEMRDGRDAFVAETRAQRRALFAILDRLENGPQSSGA